ncbi:hypothetical protein ACFUJY_29690 [Streptomyces sp. NPDC057249]|uniref:hypothetical protein n=1 Tax=Streptomyces sp. NPDC057249 TaxID=3346067 RepID=UPI00363DE5D1
MPQFPITFNGSTYSGGITRTPAETGAHLSALFAGKAQRIADTPEHTSTRDAHLTAAEHFRTAAAVLRKDPAATRLPSAALDALRDAVAALGPTPSPYFAASCRRVTDIFTS